MTIATAKKISEAMKRVHDRKRRLIETYENALIKIHRMPTSGKRAKNVAAKALNGKIA